MQQVRLFSRWGRMASWTAVMLTVFFCVRAEEPVRVQKGADGAWRIQAPAYEAVVAPSGSMTHLRIGGQEFVNSSVAFSRGTYFYQGSVQELGEASQTAPNVLEASGATAGIRYEFLPDGMKWTLECKASAAMSFFVILDPSVVRGVSDGKSDPVALVKKADWTATQWFGAGKRLSIEGGTNIWGPWNGLQVVQRTVTPGAPQEMTLHIADMTAAEKRLVETLAVAPVVKATPAVSSPAVATPATPALTAGGVKIEKQDGNFTVATPRYSARVEADGCLTNLNFGGEWIKSGVAISRGTYFYQGAALKHGTVTQSANAVEATGDKSSVRYEFAEASMKWTVENRTDQPMTFFVIFDPTVQAVRNSQGEWARVPAAKSWNGKTTWFRNGLKIETTGGNGFWGPWEGKTTVWQAALRPREKRDITLVLGEATGEEKSKAADVVKIGTDKQLPAPQVVAADLQVYSPREYQVAQRRTRSEGQVLFSGRVNVACDALRVRFAGKGASGGAVDEKWHDVALDPVTRGFGEWLALPAGGWYRAEVEALKGGGAVAKAAVEHFGVGEVFVGAGQSNSTNCGELRTKQTSGMVAAFDGRRWQLADDPIPGCHDNSGGGSFWPAFGDAMYAKYGVPVGVAPTGHGGTSVTQWKPGDELFGWMMQRIQQLGPGGFRAVLWHQGESDVKRPPAEYHDRLQEVILASKQAAGWEFPWFVAQVSYHNPGDPIFESTRSAQKALWDEAVAFEGPDTDTLTGDSRDHEGKGIHFSPKGLKAHGEMWAEKVGVYLDKALK